MNNLIRAFNEVVSKTLHDESDPNVKKHVARGKLLARERCELLFDLGTNPLEIAPFAGLNLYDGVKPGAGLVVMVGQVSGRTCVVVANDATVKGGTYFPITVKKHLRAQEIALTNKLPCIYLVDSGGAFLPLQDEVFPDKDDFGRIFYNQARLSSLNIPQISVVMGSCTAGGAYVPAMSDESIIVKNQGTIFLGGPPLVKAATGEIISAEDLGGGDVHTKLSGVVDHLAMNDSDALSKCKKIVGHLPSPYIGTLDRRETIPTRFPEDEIYTLIPKDSKSYYPMREVLARILDDSYLEEFKAEYGKTLICGFARIDGYLVGVIANDGILFSESALKGAHFIELCCKRKIPLVFFQNISGFMVGSEYERKGIAKDGAKLVTAVSCAEVPKITIIVGGSFGAGNYGMCGRAYDPRFLFMWPNAKISVMGPEQAASVLTQIKEESGKSTKVELESFKQEILQQYNHQSSCWYSTARLWDDGVILPTDTRSVISRSLTASNYTEIKETQFGVFRM